MAESGDIGRRVARRRQELGLSTEQVADRAGTAAGFVELLERQPVNVTSSAVIRLAAALLTTPEKLLGGDVELPDGQGLAAPHQVLERLSESECLRLIAPGGVGRVGYDTKTGPEVVPVNYVLDDDHHGVLFRTGADGVLARQVGETVGFEVDRIDEAQRAGWSVLVSGQIRHLALPAAQLRESIDVTPWAGGERDTYLRIEIERISGRRILT
jgi:nitroimidazol reductase NimA-like FMN-containing flavoprotein (pyridoxamine 5'-phosphate oxidase superfamily)